MKRTFVLFLLLACSFSFIYAQIDNPGFEEWEEVGFGPDITEPVNWSSIKTSDNSTLNPFAPVVWEVSDDTHTGNHSIKLFNVLMLGIPIAGTITNGRIHSDFNPDLAYSYTDVSDSRWHTAINYRPDSLVVWLKFFPQGADSMQIQGVLHVGEATIPSSPENQANWVGHAVIHIGETIDTWTRIAIKFNYFDNRTPEFVLFTFNSGNGTTPTEGSYGFLDDIELISNTTDVANIKLSEFSVYVNNNTLFIKKPSSYNYDYLSIEIIDMTGQVIYENMIDSYELSLDGLNIASGFYIVKLNSTEGSITKKIAVP